MRKDRVLAGALAAVTALSMTACGGGQAGGTTQAAAAGTQAAVENTANPNAETTLSIGYTTAANADDPYHFTATKFKEIVEEKSEGRIAVNLYASSQLGSEPEMWEGMQTGTCDMAVMTNAYVSSYVPANGALDLPFIFSDLAQAREIVDGDFGQSLKTPEGTIALSAQEKIERGQKAIAALDAFRKAQKEGNKEAASVARRTLDENVAYFGYGYIKDPAHLVPPVGLTFWSFRIMVGLGGYFILFFIVVLVLSRKDKLKDAGWLQKLALWTIPLGYIAGQAGWVVAEVGRQPWAIQDMLPVGAAISKLQTSSVQITFFIFLILFTIMLIAEINIMVKAIKKGPEAIKGE